MWKLILAIIAAIIILKYTIALIKRTILISSVKKECKKAGLTFKKCKGLYKSVFVCDGSADFEVENAHVHIFSPLFRRVRYSFTDDKRLEVIVARMQSHINSRNGKGYSKAGYVSNIFTLRNNKLKKFSGIDDTRKHIILVYPIPFEVTRVEENKLTAAYNGDEIWRNCIFSNKSYFLENIDKFAE